MRLNPLSLVVAMAPAAFAGIAQPVHIDSGPLEGIPSAVAGVTAFEGIPYAAAFFGDYETKSEDCLYLNAYGVNFAATGDPNGKGCRCGHRGARRTRG